jgi:hypothetical protein
LQRLYEGVQEENSELQANLLGQRAKIESMEKEQEVAFKNLQDEIS